MHEREKSKWSRSVVSDSLWLHGLQPTRFLCPWDFPGKSTGVGCHCLLCIKVELCFIWWTFSGLQAWETGLSDCFEGLLQRGKGGARIYRCFRDQGQVLETSKKLLLIKENQISLVKEFRTLLCVWGGEGWGGWKVETHGTHSFDMLLSYLGPVSWVFPSWASLRCILSLLKVHPWGWLQWLTAWLQASCFHPEFSQGFPLKAAVMWWPNGCSILCLLIWQATFFHWHLT